MASKSVKEFVSGSISGIFLKIFDAAAKFFTIPILVSYFGKDDFGLFTLAVSLNTYLQIMDLGMNVGSIRFFSIWIAQKDYQKIAQVSQSSIVFYGMIGLINSAIILFLAFNPAILEISSEQTPQYFYIMLILASSIVFNWISNVITQLLTANGQLTSVNQSLLIANVFNILGIVFTIYTGASLSVYFLFYTLSNLLVIPLNIYKLRQFPVTIKSLLTPRWNWLPFKEILSYSVAIFAMGLFQFSANHLRPLLLTKQSVSGIGILTDYRVIQTLAGLVIAFGSVIMQVLLPAVSKLYAQGNHKKIERVIFDGTRLTTLFIGFFCFALMAGSAEILTLYMGDSYGYLSVWLNIWLLNVLITMHNAPVASLVLASGKTKALVVINGIACIISLPITYFLVRQFSVGAAVIGYIVYTAIVILSYYFYYIPRILKLPSLALFTQSVLPGILVGSFSCMCVYFFHSLLADAINNTWIEFFLKETLFLIVFAAGTLLFVVPVSRIKEIILSIR